MRLCLDFHEHGIESRVGPEDLVRIIAAVFFGVGRVRHVVLFPGAAPEREEAAQLGLEQRPPGLPPLGRRGHSLGIELLEVTGVHETLIALLERVGERLLHGEHPDAEGSRRGASLAVILAVHDDCDCDCARTKWCFF